MEGRKEGSKDRWKSGGDSPTKTRHR
jgi:hypothetical protein